MLTTIIRRLLQGAVVMLGIVVITFVILRLIPGDPARVMASDATADGIETIRQEMALDKPIYAQLLNYLPKLLRGDMGWSYFQKSAVSTVIASTMPMTIRLLVSGVVVGLFFGMLFGLIAAINANTWIDRILSGIAVTFQSLPSYWVATMLILIVCVRHQLLPSMGYKGPIYLILPTIVVSLPVMTVFLRNVRQNVMDGLQQEFSKAARARGITKPAILFKYAFRNSLIPFLTQLGGQIGITIGTCVLVEYIFSLPGMGMQILNAILRRDYNLVQGLIVTLALLFVVVNTVVDISYAYLDPRIRKAQGGL